MCARASIRAVHKRADTLKKGDLDICSLHPTMKARVTLE
jgi:hypothetical protein